MEPLKPGDRVLINRDIGTLKNGAKGTVVRQREDGGWCISIDPIYGGGPSLFCVRRSSLDLLKPEDEDSLASLVPTKDEKSTYYDAGGISTIDFIKAKLTREQFQGFLLGNVIKYSGRIMHKGKPGRDAEKLAMYSKWLEESTKQAQ